MNDDATSLDAFAPVAAEIESYVHEHFWDPDGILYAYVDALTGKPFEKHEIGRAQVVRRAAGKPWMPWAWWTYEDTIQNAGNYLDGLVLKYEQTGDAEALRRAGDVWRMLRRVYLASQVYGIGSFLRPYGGLLGMGRFVEPLGTDQASPTFSGLYRYLKHAPPDDREQIADVMLKSLTWYEQQGFRYLYYKWLIHEWDTQLQHAASYYLPAIAWAAKTTGDPRWQRHLDRYMSRFERGPVAPSESYAKFNLYRSFYWASDLPVLKDVLGPERFDLYITPDMRRHSFDVCAADLAQTYNEPGTVRRYFPESKSPDFKPYVRADYNPDVGVGFAYYSTVHNGRSWPRLEAHFITAMAAIGHPGAFEKAVKLLLLRRRVPYDFTEFLFEDHEKLPPQVYLYARSTGSLLVEWFRNYWLLSASRGGRAARATGEELARGGGAPARGRWGR